MCVPVSLRLSFSFLICLDTGADYENVQIIDWNYHEHVVPGTLSVYSLSASLVLIF